jgi:hypothetical protein
MMNGKGVADTPDTSEVEGSGGSMPAVVLGALFVMFTVTASLALRA